ncbi:MAG: TIGR03620 family F420-dependent LLM class oxidoreductase [Proteobacteria bacterium]|nr:TIGR03620 family F420-dependent LLM class oxidoreductase [Pseudomonadota bacterium]
MKIGLMFNTDGIKGPELPAFAAALEETGLASLWVPELFGREPFVTVGALLAATQAITVATGIANVYVRDALAVRAAAATLAEFSGDRFALGLGVSNTIGNTVRGHTWISPVEKLNQFFSAYESAPLSIESGQIPVYLAAHGPRLLAIAAERTNGVLTYLQTESYNRQARAQLSDDQQLIVIQPCIVQEDPVEARRIARRAISIYLPLANYQRAWRAQGFSPADYADGGSDALVDTLVAWGSVDAVRERLEQHRQLGVDQVVIIALNTAGRGRPDLAILKELAGE